MPTLCELWYGFDTDASRREEHNKIAHFWGGRHISIDAFQLYTHGTMTLEFCVWLWTLLFCNRPSTFIYNRSPNNVCACVCTMLLPRVNLTTTSKVAIVHLLVNMNWRKQLTSVQLILTYNMHSYSIIIIFFKLVFLFVCKLWYSKI